MDYFGALMSAPLPDLIDAWQAVKAGSSFAGVIPLDRLGRLARSVLGAEGPGAYAIAFGRDGDGRAVARGRVSMMLRMTCQRCLGEMGVSVDAPIALVLARQTSGADVFGLAPVHGVPDDLDTVVVGDDPICPWDLIEDELLLAIPHFPMHPERECPGLPSGLAAMVAVDRRENPFAALAVLRHDRPRGSSDDR